MTNPPLPLIPFVVPPGRFGSTGGSLALPPAAADASGRPCFTGTPPFIGISECDADCILNPSGFGCGAGAAAADTVAVITGLAGAGRGLVAGVTAGSTPRCCCCCCCSCCWRRIAEGRSVCGSLSTSSLAGLSKGLGWGFRTDNGFGVKNVGASDDDGCCCCLIADGRSKVGDSSSSSLPGEALVVGNDRAAMTAGGVAGLAAAPSSVARSAFTDMDGMLSTSVSSSVTACAGLDTRADLGFTSGLGQPAATAGCTPVANVESAVVGSLPGLAAPNASWTSRVAEALTGWSVSNLPPKPVQVLGF